MLNTPLDFETRSRLYQEKMRLRTIKEPKVYDFIPLNYIIRVQNPLNFIPYKLVPHFNEKMFFNYLHRECFNSCVESENDCYVNCQSKHSTALELFKNAVESKRKWEPVNSYINLREYHKRPEDQGKNVPSDSNYTYKLNWIYKNNIDGLSHNTKGLEELFLS